MINPDNSFMKALNRGEMWALREFYENLRRSEDDSEFWSYVSGLLPAGMQVEEKKNIGWLRDFLRGRDYESFLRSAPVQLLVIFLMLAMLFGGCSEKKKGESGVAQENMPSPTQFVPDVRTEQLKVSVADVQTEKMSTVEKGVDNAAVKNIDPSVNKPADGQTNTQGNIQTDAQAMTKTNTQADVRTGSLSAADVQTKVEEQQSSDVNTMSADDIKKQLYDYIVKAQLPASEKRRLKDVLSVANEPQVIESREDLVKLFKENDPQKIATILESMVLFQGLKGAQHKEPVSVPKYKGVNFKKYPPIQTLYKGVNYPED
jgi:hypothetical protein